MRLRAACETCLEYAALEDILRCLFLGRCNRQASRNDASRNGGRVPSHPLPAAAWAARSCWAAIPSISSLHMSQLAAEKPRVSRQA